MSNADSTHTIRLPAGTAAKIKAATGQPLSTLVRFIVMELLAKYELEGRGSAKAEIRSEVHDVVQQMPEEPQQ